jgi:thioredoxin 1
MEITQQELREKINKGESLIVDFFANWCGPCKIMKPMFEKVSNENDLPVQMYTMNVDDNREMAVELGIRSIPTIKSFSNGKEVSSVMGLQSETQIKSIVSELVNG